MKLTTEEIDILIKYASIFDKTGEFKNADECYQILELHNDNQSNFNKYALRFRNPLKDIERSLRKNIWDPIKELGKKIDQTVRKYVPGGWVTVITMAAGAGVLGKDAAIAVKNFIGKGGKLETWATKGTVAQKAAAKAVLDYAEKEVMNKAQALQGGDQSGSASGGATLPIGSYSAGSVFGPYGATQVRSEKDNKLSNITSRLYNAANEQTAKTEWNQITKVEVPEFNKALSAYPEKQIKDSELNSIKSQLKTQKNYNL